MYSGTSDPVVSTTVCLQQQSPFTKSTTTLISIITHIVSIVCCVVSIGNQTTVFIVSLTTTSHYVWLIVELHFDN